MATLQLKRIQDALAKVRQIGRLEDSFTVLGCDLAIRTLSPTDQEEILEDCKDFEDMEYLNAFQMGNVSRAVVEVNGVDLREADFIEAEVPDDHRVVSVVVSADMAPQVVKALEESGLQPLVSTVEDGEPQTVRLERHVWLKEYVLKEWGREALNVVWRKLAELTAESEQKAKEGIIFRVPDEAPEDKYRRLLGELQELEDEMPDELVQRVLESNGYLKGTSEKEKEAIKERARKFAEEQAQKKAQEEETPSPVEEEQPPAAPRQPLNRVAVIPKVPQETVPRMPKKPVDPEIKRTAVNMHSSRAEQIAQLEGQFGLVPTEAIPPQELPEVPANVPELRVKQDKVDPRALRGIVDRPPKAGLNPRYRPPTR